MCHYRGSGSEGITLNRGGLSLSTGGAASGRASEFEPARRGGSAGLVGAEIRGGGLEEHTGANPATTSTHVQRTVVAMTTAKKGNGTEIWYRREH